MKVPMVGRSLLAAVFLFGLLVGCADSRSVNLAFSQTKVTWWVFDPAQPNGLQELPGFEQARRVTWVPRDRAVRATDVLAVAPDRGAVAVSSLGLLLVQDPAGTLEVVRPGSLLPLASYQTDRLFLWKEKLFLALRQGGEEKAPPSTLVWWTPGQPRLASLPLPSQVRDPSRQEVSIEPPKDGSSMVTFTWKFPVGGGWAFGRSAYLLDSGREVDPPPPTETEPAPLDPAYAVVRARLAERLGSGVPFQVAQGKGPLVLFTSDGWVAVSRPGESSARLYRLPEVGAAGRYSGALILSKGMVFTWETSFRGYAGAAGLVHVPALLLAP